MDIKRLEQILGGMFLPMEQGKLELVILTLLANMAEEVTLISRHWLTIRGSQAKR